MASAHGTATTAANQAGSGHARARDWAEIQERMLVPLYEAVYQRLEVGPASSVLGLGCRSGLALLLAAARGRPGGRAGAGRPSCASWPGGAGLRVLADAAREPADRTAPGRPTRWSPSSSSCTAPRTRSGWSQAPPG